MPKYKNIFSIIVPVSALCSVEVEAFNEDIAEDLAAALVRHLSVKSNTFSLQCPRTGAVVQGVIEINENVDAKIGHASINKLGD